MNQTITIQEAAGRGFTWLMLGQLLSALGSAMTSFVLSVVSYEKHGSIAELSSVILAFSLPGALATPLAGLLLDRFDRRVVLGISSLGAAACTLGIAFTLMHGPVSLWQVLLCVGGISLFGSTLAPAITAMTAALVSKEKYANVNGMWQLGGGLVMISAPLLAGVLLHRFGVRTIVLADFCSYLIAIASLLLVRLPATTVSNAEEAKPSMLNFRALRGGLVYVWQRPGLRQLLIYMALVHLVLDMIQILLVPIALGRGATGSLATVMATSSAGMIIGGLAMAISGGARRRVVGVLAAAAFLGVGLCIAGAEEYGMTALLIGMFVASAAVPFCLGSNEAIWQSKTESEYQGRVFALEAMIAQAAQPIACVVAPLACNLVAGAGSFSMHFGEVTAPLSAARVLTGSGAVLLTGTLAAFASRRLRAVEAELPEAAPQSPVTQTT